MAYVVDLDTFHGPLDLLLYLIDKNEINIYDIPIAVITDQYIEHIRESGHLFLDKVGDFLVMASYLLNLKSQLLLPKHEEIRSDEEDEPIDPRNELVNKLLVYKKYKQCADFLIKRQNGESNRVFFRDSSELNEEIEEIWADVKMLVKAFQNLTIKNNIEYDFQIPQNDFSIEEKIEQILARLKTNNNFIFQDLFFSVTNRREAIVFFLALLELIRLRKVFAIENTISGEIKVGLRVI